MDRSTLALVPLAALLATGCQINPETGRRSWSLIPGSILSSLGASSYAEATSGYPEITGTREAQMVQEISRRIVAVCGSDIPVDQWEFKLLDAPTTVNAFALPGGKIAVYSGLLRVTGTGNESALAAVIGHEIAHVTLDHGNERMSTGLLLQIGQGALEAAAQNWTSLSDDTRGNVMLALGAVSRFGVELPFSRQHETEADIVGLKYMIRAGYDPEEAPKLWERMAELSSGDSQPEFTRTHPSSERRAARLRDEIPKVRAEVEAERQAQTTPSES